MTARLIPTSSEAEWLEARKRGVTASEIAVVLGLSPYSSPYALYHQKLGILPPEEENDAMRLGSYMEGFVAAEFETQRPEFVVTGDGRGLYAHDLRPWQMATPDRLVFERCACGQPACECEPVAVLECKIDGGSDEWGEPGTDEIPVHYRCQALWQMDVMGVGTAYVACLQWNRRKVAVYELTMDAQARADLSLMRGEAAAFLGRIERQDAPDVDWRPATGDALRKLHPSVEDRDVPVGRQLVISYQAAVKHYREAERRKDEMTNRLLQAIGDGRRAVDCRSLKPVATRSVSDQTRVSATLVRERHPDVAAECSKTITVAKLTPARTPKEKQ